MNRAFINGKFYLSEGRFAQAVLVKDGVFACVGGTDEIISLAEGCETVDLDGRTVLPGFNDSHLHLYKVGVMLGSLRLDKCASVAGCVNEGREYIKKNAVPAGRAVFGYLWNQDYFADEPRNLNRHDLDKISTEHPLIAYRACGHLASCNTLALEMAGITQETADVPGGEIRRDESGRPTGIITENALGLLRVLDRIPDVEEAAGIIKSAMAYASANGITSVQTNDLRDETAEPVLDAYNLVYSRNEAVLRTYHQCCFTSLDGLKKFIAKHKMRSGGDMHRIGPIKMFVDGSLGAHTAKLRSPYADNPAATGVFCMSEAQLDEMVQTAHNAGFGCVVHAIGDGAIDRVLSSYEKVILGENRLRHGIIHCQITDLPLLERFKQSGVLALVQPIFLHYDMKIVEQRVGPQLAATSYAFNTMDRLGIHTSYGTDAPIEDLNPLNNIYCAVTRQDLSGNPPGGWGKGERVPLARAIDNYTLESAYAGFDEHKKGRIKSGFLADMCVLNSDIFTAKPEALKNIKVGMTILGGDIVYFGP